MRTLESRLLAPVLVASAIAATSTPLADKRAYADVPETRQAETTAVLRAAENISGSQAVESPSSSATDVTCATLLTETSAIAQAAIAASQRDLEIVKLLFVMLTGLGTLITGVGAIWGFKTLRDVRKSFEAAIAKETERLSEAAAALRRALLRQDLVQERYQVLVGAETARRAAASESRQTTVEYISVLEKRALYGRLVLDDLDEIAELVETFDEPTAKLRWETWLNGYRGVVYMALTRFDEAITHLELACGYAKDGVRRLGIASYGSHAYNLACALTLAGRGNEAMAALRSALESVPWLLTNVADDCEIGGDLENLKERDDFHAMLETTRKRMMGVQ